MSTLWAGFVIGQVLNVLRQGSLVAKSSPGKNPISTIRGWVWRNLIGLLLRIVVGWAEWAILIRNQKALENLTVKLPWVTDPVTFSVPLVFVTAIVFGVVLELANDWLFERWAWLKSRIPPLE